MDKIFSFQHNRLFGAHFPLDNDINKARDPYLTFKALARLSFSSNPLVYKEVVDNLAKHLSQALTPGQLMKVSVYFNKMAVIDALVNNKMLHDNVRPFVSTLIKTFAPTTHVYLAEKTASDGVKEELLRSKIISKEVKLLLAARGFLPAFQELLNSSVLPSDLEELSKCQAPHIRLLAAQHPLADKNTKIQYLITNCHDYNDYWGNDAHIIRSIYSSVEQDLSLEDITKLSSSSVLAPLIAINPRTPRTILFSLAKNGEIEAFNSIKNKISPQELSELLEGLGGLDDSKSALIKIAIAKHPNTPVINIVQVIISNGIRIIQGKPDTGHWETIWVEPEDSGWSGPTHSGKDYGYWTKEWQMDCPGTPDSEDSQVAKEIFIAHTETKRQEILAELKRIRPELAELLGIIREG